MSDCLTPVLAYRCLVDSDAHDHPSMLFESVEDGTKAGRYSIIGIEPDVEILAKEDLVTVLDHVKGTRYEALTDDPLSMPSELSKDWVPVFSEGLPDTFTGGWVGYTSYDTVRYVEKKKLPFDHAPEDDRGLPDVHLGLYNSVVVFDHVTKIIYVVKWVPLENYPSVESAYEDGQAKLEGMVARLEGCITGSQFQVGFVDLKLAKHGNQAAESNMSKEEFVKAVEKSKEHILAGDIFQLVLSQRFERRTFATPFEIYRALRVVNPSPYMIYMQARGCILVASSPEILCRIDNRTVVNRPLAGTRRRGATEEEDERLERDLLADEKECAEHVMLVDLGRNDVGKVSKAGTVKVEKLMEIERYSHVMHISSTVTGELLEEMSCWDALRAALPVGTVSGAPKVRAMELIDELEPSRRGPYAGGIGAVSYKGNMDIALALRTMVFPTFGRYDAMLNYKDPSHRREWLVHLQAGAGLVADSDPEAEYQETVNKAAALARAIDLAETAFLGPKANGGLK
ncbi:hypothetical protein CBR_g6337 [Chara braunii]|uniref:anthranilate synthase n=1 Tax=Chara braunii TaxID=69332 RepID=A0A388KJG7_CHABU|nr:hypothetical protein CBR_g6337 [Chara braunii]|eukprot:GBG70205.1 hypothetical protein CBR_g6337 [Chara braunii]